MCCLPKVVGVHPKQKPDDRPRRVSNALVDAVVAANAGQQFAIVLWKKSVKRDRARPDSVELVVWGEQLDSHAPQCLPMPDDSHGGA
jgi:hypothetical protein